jgi:hypothetical protein
LSGFVGLIIRPLKSYCSNFLTAADIQRHVKYATYNINFIKT